MNEKMRMFVYRVRLSIQAGIHVWETLLAVFVLASVIIGSFNLVFYLRMVHTPPPDAAYGTFQALIGHVLLLVVGLELAIMLIRHTLNSIIEVLLYVVARKLLVSATSGQDFILGVAAIAGLFAIRKFLFVGDASNDVKDNEMKALD